MNDGVDYDGIAERVRAGAFQWAREDVRLQPLTVRSVLLLALASACAAADDDNPYDLSEPNSKVMEEVDEMTDERSVGLFLRGAMADDSAYTVLAAMCKATREATAIGIADPTDEPPPSEQVLVRLDDEPAYRRVRSAFDLDFVRTLLLYDRLRVRDNNHTYHFDLAAARSDIVDFLKRCRALRAPRAPAAPPPQ